MYVNEANVINCTLNRDLATSPSPWRIGDAYGGGTYVFNGSIDEVMIFNRSLSAEEIAVLANL